MKRITKQVLTSFQTYLEEEEKSDATMEKYLRDVTVFAAWLKGRPVDKYAVLEYKKYLMEHYAPSSVNSVLSSLNSFFTFEKWNDCKVRTIKIQRKIFASKEKELTKEEYGRLLSAAARKKSRRLFLLLQTICSTGIRVSELRFITVEAIKNGEVSINNKGKLRRVFLPKRLCKMLYGYIKNKNISSGPIFISKSGNPLDRSNIWSEMKKLCDSAGVAKNKVFPHNLRHLFARTYYTLQKDIVRLADILGHTSVNTTRIYTMESGDIHKKQIERLGLLKC